MSIAVKALALLMGACLFGIFLGALACKYDMKKGEQHMSKWEPSNAEMRQFFNDIHSFYGKSNQYYIAICLNLSMPVEQFWNKCTTI